MDRGFTTGSDKSFIDLQVYLSFTSHNYTTVTNKRQKIIIHDLAPFHQTLVLHENRTHILVRRIIQFMVTTTFKNSRTHYSRLAGQELFKEKKTIGIHCLVSKCFMISNCFDWTVIKCSILIFSLVKVNYSAELYKCFRNKAFSQLICDAQYGALLIVFATLFFC